MKYRLKDKELQKKLDEISEGDFSPKFNAACKETPITQRNKFLVFFGGEYGRMFSAAFSLEEVEKCQEYNPNGWNNYPEVTPPEGVWMRCERPNDLCVDGIERMCLKYMVDEQGGFWTDDCESGDLGYENMRFRPWED